MSSIFSLILSLSLSLSILRKVKMNQQKLINEQRNGRFKEKREERRERGLEVYDHFESWKIKDLKTLNVFVVPRHFSGDVFTLRVHLTRQTTSFLHPQISNFAFNEYCAVFQQTSTWCKLDSNSTCFHFIFSTFNQPKNKKKKKNSRTQVLEHKIMS